jgi:hypothetical protein
VIDGITTLQPGMAVKQNLVKMRPKAADTAPQSTQETAPPASDATAN